MRHLKSTTYLIMQELVSPREYTRYNSFKIGLLRLVLYSVKPINIFLMISLMHCAFAYNHKKEIFAKKLSIEKVENLLFIFPRSLLNDQKTFFSQEQTVTSIFIVNKLKIPTVFFIVSDRWPIGKNIIHIKADITKRVWKIF